MNNLVVYTAISKDYDSLKTPPTTWAGEADFIAFLENPAPGGAWRFSPLCRQFQDPCRNAKIHKLLPHKYFPEAQYSLWVDGSVQIIAEIPIKMLVETYLGESDFAVFKHRCRHCLYDEGRHCISRGLDSREVIEAQLDQYRQAGFPPDHGLAECTVLLRRHSKAVERFNEAWYHEVATHSRRDQLSFNYVAQRLGLKYTYFPGNMASNPYFKWMQNRASRGSY